MFESVKTLLAEHEDLQGQLSDPALHSDPVRSKRVNRRYAELSRIVAAYHEWRGLSDDLEAATEMADEDESFAEEIPDIQENLDVAQERLRRLLIPRDPDDGRDVIMEIKGGEGGAESALFAADLLRMYLHYAESKGWKTELLERNESDLGGYKDVQLAIKSNATDPAQGVWAHLKYEGGVHRVQRVPVTESQGRIHTSTTGVLVFPEVDEPDEVEINPNDLKIDVYRSSGPGGQSVNTTDSAVRITHLPTNIVVQCQTDRSQHRNRAEAFAMLKSKLYELEVRKRQEQQAKLEDSKTDIGWGHQIRSYVLDQSRIKDLRTNYEVGDTQRVLDGDLDKFIEASLKQNVA